MPEIDPLRALAAAIVWRAVQDAFCARMARQASCGGMDRGLCPVCRHDAMQWLLSDEGADMIDSAGLDATAVQDRVCWLADQGMQLAIRRRGHTWITRR